MNLIQFLAACLDKVKQLTPDASQDEQMAAALVMSGYLLWRML